MLVAQRHFWLCDPVDCGPPGSSVYGHSPGKNTAVGCRALLQGIFPTQGSNYVSCISRWVLYHWYHLGSPLVTQSCPTLCNLMDCSPTGSFVHGTPQARILECVAIPLSGDLLIPGIESMSSGLWAGSLLSELPGKPKPWPLIICINIWAVLMGLMHGLKTG